MLGGELGVSEVDGLDVSSADAGLVVLVVLVVVEEEEEEARWRYPPH